MLKDKHYILLSLLVLLLNACASDDLNDNSINEQKRQVPVYMNLTLSLAGSRPESTRTNTPATRVNPDIIHGTSPENKITSLTLFVVDIETGGNILWHTTRYVTVALNLTATDNIETEIKIKTTLIYE